MNHVTQALIFDLDNTLLDRQTAQRLWSEQFVASMLTTDQPAQLAQATADLLALDRLGYATRQEFATGVLKRYPQWGRENDPRDSATNEHVDEQSTARFLAEYRRQLIALYPRDDRVCAMIDRLTESYRLGVISNGRASSQLPKMQRGGFDHSQHGPFDAVVISEAVGFEKPHPEPFLTALRNLNVPATRAIYIGDNPEHDIAGAAAVGLRTCWVALGRQFPDHVAQPDLVIDTILDLEHALTANPPEMSS